MDFNMDRRRTFGDWFRDVGFLYVIVAVSLGAIFAFANLPNLIRSAGEVTREASPVEQYFVEQ